MRLVRGTVLAFLLIGCGGVLAACESMENFQFWDTKKKLAGERKEVFPGGVPGVTQGVPPELVRGYQEPQQPAVDPAAVAAQESAEKIEPKAEAKPKPKKVAKPRPAPQPQSAPPPSQAGWATQQPQPAAQPQPAPAGWPASQPQAQQQSAPWPQAR
jgi:hypothetical protein